MTPLRVILASQSPRRRELLTLVGITHEVRPADIDEAYFPGEVPTAHAERLARGKCAVIAEREPDALVIGSDTIVVVDGDVLGKPTNEADAAQMLRRLSGRSHIVVTAVAVAIRGAAGNAAGTVSVAGPTLRLPPGRVPELAAALTETARVLGSIWPSQPPVQTVRQQ